ncbi:MAG TPA: hypothetical protein VL500_06110 [Candidatus Eisenbacteria bacterium]|nr:hypothetical protein [Candidatus Eisenbacteria bacterium]
MSTPRRRLVAALSAAALLLAGLPAVAVTPSYTYLQDTDLQVGSHLLRIAAGSQRQGMTVGSTSVAISVAAGEAFILWYPGPDPKALENDASQAVCNVTPDRNNQMTLNGPITVTVTPSDFPCPTSNASSNGTPKLTLVQPNGGQTVKAGDQVQVLWTTTGTLASLRLSLSTDGGQSITSQIATDELNDGFYSWTVPTITTTSQARLRLDGFDQGRVVAFDLSDADFTVQGTAPTQTGSEQASSPVVAYDPVVATAEAASIDENQDFRAPTDGSTSACIDGLRIKGLSNPAVYYCGRDGKRHAFPNQKIHASWYADFNGVTTVSDATLASISLGASVTYRPGVRMLKIQTDPKVYAVAKGGELRWVQTEASAAALYGADWNMKIDDISDAFFTDYHVGDPVPPPQ